jgi:dihydrofolate reductase
MDGPGMAALIYAAITSLDGYINDAGGGFEWSAPDEEVHLFVNGLERRIGTHLYGRRMYEVMRVWQDWDADSDSSASAEYAGIWRAADKVVFSRTLSEVSTPRTRLEREFDPELVRQLKVTSPNDLSVGGAALASAALREGLVDECHLFLNPVIIGGGTRALPDGVRVRLELLEQRRFGNGVVHLHYRLL